MPPRLPTLLKALVPAIALALALPLDARVRVDVSGLDSELAANVRAHLDLVRFAERDDLSEAAIRRLYDRSPQQIRDALRPFGYYSPGIERTLERDNGDWRARFTVEAGEPVRLVEVDVRVEGPGREHPSFRRLLADSPLAAGQRLRHRDYDQLRTRLDRAAQTHGYFDRRFVQRRLEVDPEAREARVMLVMETGEQYRFGEVTVDQDILSDSLMERLVYAREGEPFDNDRVLRTQYALTDSQYFSNVLVDMGSRDRESLTVPVHVDTAPTRRQRIRLGIGYGTDTEARASLGWDWRRINRHGHRASLDTTISEPLIEFAAQYLIPIGDPLTERIGIRSALVSEDLADTRSRRLQLGVNHRRVLGNWQRNLFTDLVQERTRLPGEPAFTDTLVVPGIGYETLISDDPVLPEHGYRLRSELRGSHNLLGSRVDFARLNLAASYLTSAGENWSFLLRSELGLGLIGGFGELPASQRFFAGGDQSVRGYAYNTLGPRDDEGRVIGGRHLMFASAEARRRLTQWVQLAAFVDTGNALTELDDELEVAAGGGVHVTTPIGRVRVELARSVSESKSWRLHVSIRPDL